MKKLIPIFALLILCFYSCKKESKKTYTQPKDIPLKERPIPKFQNSNIVTGVAGGAHYICPNNCEGGTSSKQGTCSICNSALTHNQGFHNTPKSTKTTPSTTTPKPKPTSEPKNNRQYHYVCSNGCAGGGDSAGKCTICSGDLVHNAIFHN